MTVDAPAYGLRERLKVAPDVARNVRRSLALVAGVDRSLLLTLVAAQVVDALTLVAVAWVGKQIIDAVVHATTAHRAAAPALWWVGAELALVSLRAAAQQVNAHALVVLRARLGLEVNTRVLDKAANVSYPHFEEPEFLNRMAQVRREATARPVDIVTQSMALVRHGVTLVGYAGLLWSLGAWALPALVVIAAPSFVVEARYGQRAFELQRRRTQRNRQAFYLETALTTEATAREARLFGATRWLIDRFREVHLGFQREEIELSLSRTRWSTAATLAASAVFYGAYVFIVREAVAGRMGLGAMTLYLVVFRQGQSSLGAMLSALARVYEDNLYMGVLFDFLSVVEDEPDAPLTRDEGDVAPPEVRFERVSFRYPDAEADALTELDLVLRPGETVALVGRNGAGKTTVVKLLLGLHRPTGGRILVDGVDAATLHPAELRRRVGVILQDFARWQFSAADNVGLGWMPAIDDRAAVERAVEDAGAERVIARLPQGLDTPLGRAFGGDELSGGQWQRVALARAFMRRSKLLVLDEPTAALDAEAEHEVFQRLRDLKRGRTALIITHRFSTVRMADRIVVIEGGRVVEEGSHADLIALEGRYARLFEMQAEGYRP
ncbi:MAG: ABC transporter ATP-binding protein [Polyangiales bacterium]